MRPEDMAAPQQGSPHFRQYVHLLKRLHGFIADGKGNSDDANAIREELDQHIGDLSEREYRRAEGLCEDLYTLVEDEPPPSATSVARRSREEIVSDLSANWERDWDRVLELLREGASFIPIDVASYVRGRSWDDFGESEIALLFFARASQLNSTNANLPDRCKGVLKV